jgi:formylglycine-generating enzyme
MSSAVYNAPVAAPTIAMVSVKGGCYQMGDTFGDGEQDEKPEHQVCVDDFSIGTYLVTQAEWQAVMGDNPSSFAECGGNCPVESVSWKDAKKFIRQLNARTGKRYRLPTEAEWEYAARSGGKQEKWAGTIDANRLDEYAWYKDNSDMKTHEVGQKQPNGLGLYDMSGNVWEWCQDRYDEKYYEQAKEKNPKGPESGEYRVMRGGSWNYDSSITRAAYRGDINPDNRNSDLGFRLAASAQ